MDHISRRVYERDITLEQLRELSNWLDSEPIAPQGKWFKRFGSFIICGESDLVKTVLTQAQLPTKVEMK